MLKLMISKKEVNIVGIAGFVLCLTVCSFIFPSKARASGRISLSPSPLTLTEGQSQVVTVSLDEPIICEDPEATCNVSVSIVSDHPDRLTITGAPIVIPYNEWFQPHTFTIMAVNNSIHDGDASPAFTLATTSASEFYSGFTPAFAVSILDDDPIALPTEDDSEVSTNDQTQPSLADTGTSQFSSGLLASIIFGSSLILMCYVKYLSSHEQ